MKPPIEVATKTKNILRIRSTGNAISAQCSSPFEQKIGRKHSQNKNHKSITATVTVNEARHDLTNIDRTIGFTIALSHID